MSIDIHDDLAVAEMVYRFAGFTKDGDEWVDKYGESRRKLERIECLNFWHDYVWPAIRDKGPRFVVAWTDRLTQMHSSVPYGLALSRDKDLYCVADAFNESAQMMAYKLCEVIEAWEANGIIDTKGARL